jgi:hypothetical protein
VPTCCVVSAVTPKPRRHTGRRWGSPSRPSNARSCRDGSRRLATDEAGEGHRGGHRAFCISSTRSPRDRLRRLEIGIHPSFRLMVAGPVAKSGADSRTATEIGDPHE